MVTILSKKPQRLLEINMKIDDKNESPLPSNGKSLMPHEWMAKAFPKIQEKVGRAFDFEIKEGKWRGKNLSDDFFAALMGPEGCRHAPVVYLPSENRFYQFYPKEGIYKEVDAAELMMRLANLLHRCANACESQSADVSKLRFSWRRDARLKGVIDRAKARLRVQEPFFELGETDEVVLANGIYSIKEQKLLPFGQERKFRNKIEIVYRPDARCSQFLEMIQSALDADDIEMIQQWCGLALFGVNRSQVMLYLIGRAGTGKSTLAAIVEGIIGKSNVTTLRTALLSERFEMARFVGRTLLTGLDVPAEFLNQKAASLMKSLTGADSITGEIKYSTKNVEMNGRYNVLLTSNARPKIHLEDDRGAWKRRLTVVLFLKDPPKDVVAELSVKLLREEAEGILNWMLKGLTKLYENGWQFKLNDRQRRRVDDILDESLSIKCFGESKLLANDAAKPLSGDELYQSYLAYCRERQWRPESRNAFGSKITRWLESELGLYESHDIKSLDGGTSKGWRGLTVKPV